ncbi:MAG TPA: sulfurtransferase complex subunit TusD [Buchnera sp. (in: enterobacteria)]|nr:sulfurtransferase complex subunit TusD [Buchnera sp. (in: enterobacteria)]
MNYMLIVTGPPYGTENSSTALLFSRALINYGHKLNSVFFYFNGVLNASEMISPADDEFNLVQAWQELSYHFKIKLHVCISAAYRRGIIGDSQALKIGINKGNLAHGFILIGLNELSEYFQTCDRIIQF